MGKEKQNEHLKGGMKTTSHSASKIRQINNLKECTGSHECPVFLSVLILKLSCFRQSEYNELKHLDAFSFSFPFLLFPSLLLIFHPSRLSPSRCLVSLGYEEVRWRFPVPLGLISSLSLSTTSTHTHTQTHTQTGRECVTLSPDNRYWLRRSNYTHKHTHSWDKGRSWQAVTCCLWTSRGKPCEVMVGMHTNVRWRADSTESTCLRVGVCA